MTMPVTILRFPAVTARTGTPISTIRLRIEQGLFVRPVHLGGRSIGFPDDEVEALNQARIRGLSDDRIRALVVKLERRRASIGGEWGELGSEPPQAAPPAPVGSPRARAKPAKRASTRRVAPKGTRSPQVGA